MLLFAKSTPLRKNVFHYEGRLTFKNIVIGDVENSESK